MKIRKIHIEDYKIFKNFDLDLTYQDKALNLIVLAGVNGTGKTTLLRDIIKRNFNKDGQHPYCILSIEVTEKSGESSILDLQYHKIVNTILNSSDSDENENKFYLSHYSDFVKFYPSNHNDLINSDIDDAKKAIIDFIEIQIHEKDIVASKVYTHTQQILALIFKDFDLQIEFDRLNGKKEIFFKNEFSDKIKIEDLSGGERELITKAFSLYLSDIKDSVILIDEPESSLHPNWQNRIVKIYEDFANANNNQIIMATHSPQIIGSVRKENLRILVNNEGRIEVLDSSNIEGSYGWDVEKVLAEIMGTENLRNPEIDAKLEEIRQMVYSNQYETNDYKNKYQELEDILGYYDKDLMLLRLEAFKRQKQNGQN